MGETFYDSQDRRDDPDRVASRLDALSMPLAERVIRRAIELDDRLERDRISRDALNQIAAELGIGASVVQRALVEELAADTPRSSTLRQRLLAPDQVSKRTVVDGNPRQVALAVDRWMTRHEGMRPRARDRFGTTYEKDPNIFTSLRMGLKLGRGTGSLRDLGSVTVRQTDVAEGVQLVELEADTAIVSKVAAGVGGGLAVAGLVAGVFSALQPGGSDVAQFVAPALPAPAVGAGTAVAIAKGWLHAIGSGVERAIDGIRSPELWR